MKNCKVTKLDISARHVYVAGQKQQFNFLRCLQICQENVLINEFQPFLILNCFLSKGFYKHKVSSDLLQYTYITKLKKNEITD